MTPMRSSGRLPNQLKAVLSAIRDGSPGELGVRQVVKTSPHGYASRLIYLPRKSLPRRRTARGTKRLHRRQPATATNTGARLTQHIAQFAAQRRVAAGKTCKSAWFFSPSPAPDGDSVVRQVRPRILQRSLTGRHSQTAASNVASAVGSSWA